MFMCPRKNCLLDASIAQARLWSWAGLISVLAVLPATAATPPDEQSVPKVRSQVFDIGYQVSEAALPLLAVHLWYTLDRGQSWRHYGRDDDAQSPMPFHARDEGLCGFYFVVTNDAGASGNAPGPDTEPQQWAMVDYTPPIVQLHSAEQDPDSLAYPMLRIRWTAIDQHLPTRPVGLWYRSVPAGEWAAIVRDVANTGRYDWRVPDDVTGSIVVRVTVRDHGGHLVAAISPATEVVRTRTQATDSLIAARETHTAESGALDPADQTRIQALAARGVWHADRGEHRLAVARFRDALKLDAGHADALLGMADSLYTLGDQSPSIEAYQLLLKRDPTNRDGLERLARALVAQRKYPAAVKQLEILVRQNPDDVMGWLELGDVALYQGDQVTAAEHYRRAATLDPAAAEVVTMAKARLANLSGVAEHARNIASRP